MAQAPDGIVAEGVARAFGSVAAVRSATLRVPYGSVTGLIGPNGSGKTTLMLMLATLLKPDAGSIRVAGVDPVADARAVRAHMGWMPDILGSWASLSVRDTIEITARMYRMDKRRAAARAHDLVMLVGLTELADRPTRVLSRGQKQRLSLARALVHDPSVLLLDEPASGLDPAARAELRDLVRRLAGEGKAILVSSHVLSELDEMADAAVYVSAGVTASSEAVQRAIASERAWRIRALDRMRLADALVSGGIPAERVGVDNLGSLVPIAGDEQAAALLRHLVTAGVDVVSFGPAVGNLEHAYLDLNRPGAGEL